MNGLLGGTVPSTQNLMQQYLQNLFMRRYNPPAVSGTGVTSQMGQGGMQYQASPQMWQGLLNPQAQQPQQQSLLTQPGFGPSGESWGYM